MFKMAVQQGRRAFGAWSVQAVREPDKSLRTPPAGIFTIPIMSWVPWLPLGQVGRPVGPEVLQKSFQ